MKNLVLSVLAVLFVFSFSAVAEEKPNPEKKITVEFDGVPLAKAIQKVCKDANLSFSINERAMRHAGAVVCSFKNISAEAALRALAESAGLDMYNTAWEEDEDEEEGEGEDEDEDDNDNDEDDGDDEEEERVGVYVFQLNLERGRDHHEEEEERERRERHGFNRMPEEIREKLMALKKEMRDAEGEEREKIMKQIREIMMDFHQKNRGNNKEGNEQHKKRNEERAVF
ncbi:MAG: hypothetical protein ACYTFY_20575 [Planctomycetota bacterium]|jgi:hypothetical protein